MSMPTIDLATAVHGAARLRPPGLNAGVEGGRAGKVGVLIHVEPELRKRLRRLAVDEDTTLQALGVEAFEQLLAERTGTP